MPYSYPMTESDARAKLLTLPQPDLYDLCQDVFKEQHGIRGRHMVNYPVADLVDYFCSVYRWDEYTGIHWFAEELTRLEDRDVEARIWATYVVGHR